MSVEYLSRTLSNPDRPRKWEDAVHGLPTLTRIEAASIRKERLSKKIKKTQPEPRSGQDVHGYSYQGYLVKNSIVGVVRDYKDIAEAGEEGYVAEVRDEGRGESYRVIFDRGEDWFREIDVERYLIETGKEKT